MFLMAVCPPGYRGAFRALLFCWLPNVCSGTLQGLYWQVNHCPPPIPESACTVTNKQLSSRLLPAADIQRGDETGRKAFATLGATPVLFMTPTLRCSSRSGERPEQGQCGQSRAACDRQSARHGAVRKPSWPSMATSAHAPCSRRAK